MIYAKSQSDPFFALMESPHVAESGVPTRRRRDVSSNGNATGLCRVDFLYVAYTSDVSLSLTVYARSAEKIDKLLKIKASNVTNWAMATASVESTQRHYRFDFVLEQDNALSSNSRGGYALLDNIQFSGCKFARKTI